MTDRKTRSQNCLVVPNTGRKQAVGFRQVGVAEAIEQDGVWVPAFETATRIGPFAPGSASSKLSTEVPIDGTKISPKRSKLQAESLEVQPKRPKVQGGLTGGARTCEIFSFCTPLSKT